MIVTKKELKRTKKTKIKNRHLVKKYPWLKPWRRWKKNREQYGWDKQYKYQYTTLDGIPYGWYKAFGEMMLEELDEEIRKSNLRNFRITYVKEKWGYLNVYASGFNDKIMDIINKYETLSQNICAVCGKPDVGITNRGWIYPLCYKCYSRSWRINTDMDDDQIREIYNKDIAGSTNKMPDVMSKIINGNEVTTDISDTAEKIRQHWKNKNKLNKE